MKGGSTMIERTIREITEMISVENDVTQIADIHITGVCIDTRKIEKGNLFIPFKGENTDGHTFAAQAIEAGASAVLWQKDVPLPEVNFPVIVVENTLDALQQLAASYRQQLQAKIVAITGSNGKTTTKDIAASVISQQYRVHKTDGNFNNHIGMPLTILGMSEDTEVGIVEMGMSGFGEIELLTKIAQPDYAMITNIGEAHMKDLGSREGIATAKFEIVKGLKEKGVLIFPKEEPLLQAKLPTIPQVSTRTFGFTTRADYYPNHIEMNEEGTYFTVPTVDEQSFYLSIPGKHNIANALAVIGVAKCLDMDNDSIRQGLKEITLSNMRMEWNEGYKGTKILNDAYNSSPTATKAVISMVENFSSAYHKILVLGDMLELGDQTIDYHREIGESIDAERVQYVFTYGELSKYIAEGAKRNFAKEHVFHFLNQDELVHAIKQKITGKEIILIKASRGMKMEQTVNALK